MACSRFLIPTLLSLVLLLFHGVDVAAQKGGRGFRGNSFGGGKQNFQQGRGRGPKLRSTENGKSRTELFREDGHSFSRGGSLKSAKSNRNPNRKSVDSKRASQGIDRKSERDPGFGGGNQDRKSGGRAATELRKLEHRQQVAEHLRRISQINGNSRLTDVANRLDEKALSHYENQLGKIETQQLRRVRDATGLDSGSLRDSIRKSGGTSPDPLSAKEKLNSKLASSPAPQGAVGLNQVSQRQIFAAEKTMNQRLQVAEKLRRLGQAQANPDLLSASQQMEEMALQQYTEQLTRLAGVNAGKQGGLAGE